VHVWISNMKKWYFFAIWTGYNSPKESVVYVESC
jgi:hypothetical protein